ncbi:hypothetical protein ACIOEW_38220 [Streptomyces sp. NPDC087901]|uniref:hypothetical protein n=1 Tax=unclassified Streptomyces TaxID=2593676 RepID=UPI00344A05D4
MADEYDEPDTMDSLDREEFAARFRHKEETAEVVRAPEEIAHLRQELTQLRSELAPREATTTLSIQVSKLREEMVQLQRETERRATANWVSSQMIEVRKDIGRRAAKEETQALRQELKRKTLVLREEVQCETTALEKDVARLRKQLGDLKREISDLSGPRDERLEELGPQLSTPPSYRYEKPYRLPSDLEHLLGETPRAVSEWQRAMDFDPYKHPD